MFFVRHPMVRFARVSSHVDDFNTRNKVVTAKLLRQGYRYHKLRKTFSKFYRQHFDFGSKYNVELKYFFCKAFLNMNFIAILVYKFRKIICKYDFPYHFKRIIVRYKKIGYDIDVLHKLHDSRNMVDINCHAASDADAQDPH